jgi:hypothetical protein
MIHRTVVRCSARAASTSRRSVTSLATNSARRTSTLLPPIPRRRATRISAAAMRSATGSSSSPAKRRNACSVGIRETVIRRASMLTGVAMGAGILRAALCCTACSSPHPAVSRSASRRVHCSRASSRRIRSAAALPTMIRGTATTAAATASPATGHPVSPSTVSPEPAEATIRRAGIRSVGAARLSAHRLRRGDRPADGAPPRSPLAMHHSPAMAVAAPIPAKGAIGLIARPIDLCARRQM